MKSFQINPNKYGITIEDIKDANIFVIPKSLIQLKNKLNVTKSKLDDIYKSKYAVGVMISFDPFVSHKYKIANNINAYNVTNAWLKGYELFYHFNLIPSSGKFVYFDNASFPGSFILAANHYVRTQTNIDNFQWYGSSLLTGNKLNDDFDLKKNYPCNWLMNENNNGDITNINNIIDYQKQLTKDGERIVNLYTCDLGMDCGDKYNEQEVIHFNANICQIICGLLTLKSGGNMAVKHFTIFEPFTISYISLLSLLFNETYITKPLTSKRTNSEIYIVCKGYKYPFDKESVEQHIIQLFINSIGDDLKNPLITHQHIESQIKDITNACNVIYSEQISALNKFVYSVRNVRSPLINGQCYQALMQENKKLIDEFKKIKIKPSHILNNLVMKKKY